MVSAHLLQDKLRRLFLIAEQCDDYLGRIFLHWPLIPIVVTAGLQFESLVVNIML